MSSALLSWMLARKSTDPAWALSETPANAHSFGIGNAKDSPGATACTGVVMTEAMALYDTGASEAAERPARKTPASAKYWMSGSGLCSALRR